MAGVGRNVGPDQAMQDSSSVVYLLIVEFAAAVFKLAYEWLTQDSNLRSHGPKPCTQPTTGPNPEHVLKLLIIKHIMAWFKSCPVCTKSLE